MSDSNEMTAHISSIVVLCRPESLGGVESSIETMDAAEVHARDPAGKLVVVTETPTEAAILEVINEIEAQEGVLNVSLVFHQVDEPGLVTNEGV